MNFDLEKRVPREILAELIEEGTECPRNPGEVVQRSCQLERSEILGAKFPTRGQLLEPDEGIGTDSKRKRMSDSSGRAALGDSTGASPNVEVLCQVAGEGLDRPGEGPEAGHIPDDERGVACSVSP